MINEQRIRNRIMELQQARMNGVRNLADMAVYKHDKKKRDAALSAMDPTKRKRIQNRPGTELFEPSKRQKAELSLVAPNKETNFPGPLMDMAGMEGVEMLSKQETQLCATLHLIPQHYMVIKERLLRESYSRGFLQPGMARQLLKIDITKTDKIMDFFISAGWTSNAPQGAIIEDAPLSQQNPKSGEQSMPAGFPGVVLGTESLALPRHFQQTAPSSTI